jgi:hypothetical protein
MSTDSLGFDHRRGSERSGMVFSGACEFGLLTEGGGGAS